ncbi:aldehyde dehydrogenase family protein [Mucilaginibacter rubeus]|uniref:Aldehyde dehydrogenase n=1 Tax=Mucilaginibacter rubeus TaxID=2027860 RepID=A0AAE6JJR9_9SPHI|nr:MULTISPECIES: aldehyde dehydrogenase family protein [Mucilaginibacter]QEM07179.1 aldehyde dehydrogenase family protein [Mucilaginibacter rubeus]QEM19635.1 aldehyde dehydrogenase family protein [Mucilaginibacter gossypii]QTE43671.1 aldehyde dehydrogenase family protein [Mucilaginibacter rubeus]QTE50271.1 aldehyde dehydrogenase family protein [Mucilaginibacter rubeus]QTE55358.1 aldehyde dehydrogenase family protein [Mucilaginibacter rubeus]
MEELVKAQRDYFNSNATKPVEFRITQLQKLKGILKENTVQLNEAVFKDFGKGTFENIVTELFIIHQEIDDALKNLAKWAAVKPVETDGFNQPGESFIVPEPLGVSLIIGAWNYPLNLTLSPAVAAIAAGCTVVLKPSRQTEHCSKLMASLINNNFDPAFFTVVEGGRVETNALLEQQFDKIFFTGSVPVGKIVYQAAAKHLTPVTLELGGKSPAIVLPDADLQNAVRKLVWGKFINGGQTCIAPDYIYVHRSVETQFLQLLKDEIVRADYRIENNNYANIITVENTERLVNLIDQQKVVLGGGYDIEGRIIEPTVMTNVTWDDKIMQDEIFGPVLPVMTFEDLGNIISVIKQQAKPLALYLFTADDAATQRVLSEVSFGGGAINETIMHTANGALPFGGVGNSGTGNYHGEAGFRSFSHYKSVLKKPVSGEPDFRYPPHNDEKIAAVLSMI